MEHSIDVILCYNEINLLTGCYPPFGNQANEDNQESTTPDNKEDPFFKRKSLDAVATARLQTAVQMDQDA